MNKIRCNLHELLLCLSNAQDLISPLLSNHHQQVAYLSFRLSEQLGLTAKDQKEVFHAALVHDIGALSSNELLTLTESEPVIANNHAFKGAILLEGFKPLKSVAKLVKFHHIPWNNGAGKMYNGEDVPLYSHIIHLADRVCANIQLPNHNILSQLPNIIKFVNENTHSLFVNSFVNALNQLSKKEYIWLDLISRDPVNMLPSNFLFENITLDINDTIDFAMLFSRIIDFRSRFTACHSAGVAKVAERIAQLMSFSPTECKMMLIAGYLHDLGKVAIDNSILEKPDNLEVDEFNEIRAHSYYTYTLLDEIQQFDTIKVWAAYHHERLDGKGYPFHIRGEDIPLGSRIMAVADIFTAITEDRPYRKGMDFESTTRVLDNMVTNGALDKNVVGVLKEHFNSINTLREQSQHSVSSHYKNFIGI